MSSCSFVKDNARSDQKTILYRGKTVNRNLVTNKNGSEYFFIKNNC